MSKHNNPSISERARKIFNNQLNQEISNEVLDYITPTVNIIPYVNVVKYHSGNGNATIYNPPADKDFYLVALELSIDKSAASTGTSCSIRANIGGVNTFIAGIAGTASTLRQDTISITFKYPIKIDRGGSVSVNDGASQSYPVFAAIYGYTEEIKNPATN